MHSQLPWFKVGTKLVVLAEVSSAEDVKSLAMLWFPRV
jgi:hypothetical protein